MIFFSRFEEFYLEAKGSDRMNVKYMTTVISHQVCAGFRAFFPQDERLLELADILEEAAFCLQIMQSRVIEDKRDKFNCAFR